MLVVCIECSTVIKVGATPHQVQEWKESGKPIQVVMPEVSEDDRELLISRTCKECWDAMWIEGRD